MIERVRIKKQRQKPNRKAFTDLWIERLKPPKDGQELYWDTGQKGLSLLVSPKGAKAFRSQFKLNGKWETRTIGRFGEVAIGDDKENANVAWAREQVRKDRALAKEGTDPRAERKRRSKKYEDVVDQFIELYAKPRQRTWHETERVLKSCTDWHKRQIDRITKRDAYDILDGFIADGHGPKARVTLSWLKTLWRWAYKRDLVTAPIMDAVTIDYQKTERDRFYSDDEIKTIWRAADKLDPVEGGYIKLLLLLAPRKKELAGMRWSELDNVDNPTLWTTPFERTKARKSATKRRVYLTPLPPLAQRVLKGLPKRNDDDDEANADLVFPSRAKGVPLWPGSPLKRKLVEHGVANDFTYHAIRHTVATWLENAGHSEWERGLVLNHASSGVTAGYSHGYPLELKRNLLTKWAKHVEGLVVAEGVSVLR
ncbi:integrase family protein [Kaustia mangrovi]|uniref:Integrase family protein n=1 Tax=Kaustia mangrovi TaxID=2593653 RepID=A0A7S8HCW9_9HYPH|nr:integrase family protein [Kaustia mangrovi]QPC43889.1 integrase family protein [Kaustia mangrovi]